MTVQPSSVEVRPGVGRPVVLLWRHLGPYHVARAEAASRLLASESRDTIVVQLAGGEQGRDWAGGTGDGRLRVETLSAAATLDRRSPSMARALRALLDRERPAAVAVAGYDRPEMRAGLAWAARHGAAPVLMSETKHDDRARPAWRRVAARFAARHARAALVSGTASREYAIALGIPPAGVFTPYGVVDNDHFAQVADRERASGAGARPCFLAASRLIERRKNLLRLLDAYATYRTGAGAAAWPLVLCGDGPDRGLVERHLRARRIEGVELPGFEQVDALARRYAHAGAFVHAATREAWGLVVNEAMAAGLPVLVSARAGCARDLVREGENGWTFDPLDVPALARLLARVADLDVASRVRMGRASREIVAAYAPARFAEGLLAAIRFAQGRGGRGA